MYSGEYFVCYDGPIKKEGVLLMKKIIALLLTLCLVLSLGACGGKATVEGKGYDTPEEAIVAYAEAIRSGELAKIMSTYAVETYVDRFDLEAYIEWMGCYYCYSCPLPNTDAQSREMNLVDRQAEIGKEQEFLYLSVVLGEEYKGNAIPYLLGGEYTSASKLTRAISEEDWMEILAEMEIGDVADYRDLDVEKDDWKSIQNSYADKETFLGCDELTGLAVEITLDGEDYYLLAELACYDGKWYVNQACGVLGNYVEAYTVCGLLPR